MLDSLADGLEVFSLKSAISAFPDQFQELFVASGSCSAEAVMSIVQLAPLDNEEKIRVAGHFKSALKGMSESGKWKFGLGPVRRGDYRENSTLFFKCSMKCVIQVT